MNTCRVWTDAGSSGGSRDVEDAHARCGRASGEYQLGVGIFLERRASRPLVRRPGRRATGRQRTGHPRRVEIVCRVTPSRPTEYRRTEYGPFQP